MSFYHCDKCGGIPGLTWCCTDNPWRRDLTTAQGQQSVMIELIDGSQIKDCVPQLDGDFWWEGAGAGERFFPPASVTAWRRNT